VSPRYLGRRAFSQRRTSSVLRDKYNPFRRGVVARFPKAEEPERVPDLPVGLFWTILNHIPLALRPCYVTMVAAGLGPKEFVSCEAADLLPDSFGLLVTGHKNGRKGRTPVYFSEALWPWVTAAVPCSVPKDLLADHWKRACRKAGRGDLRLYDLRHCFGQWLTNAGVPDALIQTGMRHRTAGMTRRYTKQVHKGQTAAAMGTLLVVPPLALASGA